jgi:UDP-2,3-diacylglucosamine pyrophosphatase LpxH
MTTIFAISDLHLCDRGARDNFNARGEDRFLRFLDYVDHERGTLLVLGDLLDCWQCNFSASIMSYQKLLRAICCVPSRWVIGNHDGLLAEFLGTNIQLVNAFLPDMSGPFETTLGGRRVAFAHGHECDPTCNSVNPGLGELTAIISGMLEDRNKSPNKYGRAVEDFFIGSLEAPLNLWRNVTWQKNRDAEMLGNAEVYRKAVGADVLVYGHTHTPTHTGTLVNSGCWCRDTDTFVRMDDGVPSLYVWDGERPRKIEKELG